MSPIIISPLLMILKDIFAIATKKQKQQSSTIRYPNRGQQNASRIFTPTLWV